GDQRRILLDAVVDDVTPVGVGPAVEAAILDRGQVVGRGLVADTVALVDHGPELAGGRLEGEADRVAQATGEDAAFAGREVKFEDAGAAFLDLHAVVADIALGTDADIELGLVSARQETPGPVAVRLGIHQLLA